MGTGAIRVFPSLQAVRARPKMYCDPLSSVGLLSLLLGRIVAEQSEQRVLVTCGRSGSFSVEVGAAVLPSSDGMSRGVMQPAVLLPLLSLYAPGLEGAIGGLPILNALSEFMRLRIREAGKELTVETSQGGLVEGLRRQVIEGSDRTLFEVVPDSGLVDCSWPKVWGSGVATVCGVECQVHHAYHPQH